MADGAVYKTLMSVDTRGSGSYLDGAKRRMRARIYDLANASFAAAGVAKSMLHLEDRGDGFIAAVDARIPPVQLLGTWLAEMHQRQRTGNEDLARRLGLRVGLHVGPVEHDEEGLSSHAMDLVCRLADSPVTRTVLEHSGRDLVLVVSDSLHHEVVRHGGRFVEPSAYRPTRVALKEGPVTAWFHVPGEARPRVPGDEGFGTPPVDASSGENGDGSSTGAEAEGPSPGRNPGHAVPAAADRPSADGDLRAPGTEAWPVDTGSGAHWDIKVEGGTSVVQDRATFQGPVHFGGSAGAAQEDWPTGGDRVHGRRRAGDGNGSGHTEETR
ncbi:hypothetical protein [Streptomyces sp. SID12501]|uniref:Guanylate cyclase domain-containing protein n=1 Tax=Streptomyces sp. SID12501 TaxID=2706042 RepID=A0A6B3C708_9ACTN|nr:hypothetical protein [Streptomyces sp. SID12501]NEC92468.1 hypothetical protein [Streptomyces sp. SID12501]